MSLGLYQGLGAGGPSAHSDVLTAAPDNIDSQRALVEEIKRRGRATVGSKSYLDAEALYSKGIEVLDLMVKNEKDESVIADLNKETAILFSNRSLVKMQLGKITEALEDADAAVERDPGYVKAHWRQGQAFTACGQNFEALKSFEKALELEPENKALRKEVAAAKDRKEQEEKLMADAAEKAKAEGAASDSHNDRDVVMKDASESTNATPTSAKTAIKNATSDSKTKPVSVNAGDKDEYLFTKSDHVRGYKIRSDGKKTSYFDREIDEDTKKLIGDIAPKKIDQNINGASEDCTPKPSLEGASAWNKAGTWEERDVTPWAKETLEAALLATEYIFPDGSPSPGAHGIVSKVTKIDGHASYATVRGKKRYIYEFGLAINWVLTLGDDHKSACHGSMTFPDIDGTVDLGDGYDMVDYHVEGSSPAGTGPLLDRFVRDGGLRDSIHKSIDDWVRLFRATY